MDNRANFRWEYDNISLPRGDTFSFGFELYDENGDPMIQELAEASFTCKDNASHEIIYEKTIGNGIEKAGEGAYTVRVSPEDTADILAGLYFYALRIYINSDVFTLFSGTIAYDYEIPEGGGN